MGKLTDEEIIARLRLAFGDDTIEVLEPGSMIVAAPEEFGPEDIAVMQAFWDTMVERVDAPKLRFLPHGFVDIRSHAVVLKALRILSEALLKLSDDTPDRFAARALVKKTIKELV